MSIYTGYEPAAGCTGRSQEGAKALMAWYLGAYSAQGGTNLGIYNCRNIAGSQTLSLHGEGRACDLGVPVGKQWAQTLADTLVAHSAELGIQLVIYNRKAWSGRRPYDGWRDFTGDNPHRDHLHVELSWNAARSLSAAAIQTEFHSNGQGSPPWPGRHLRYTPGHVMRGDDVRMWQQRMKDLGRGIAVDGLYGPQSAAVARDFQQEKGLEVDGIVGPQTWRASWLA
jgi:hypothetical protein